MAAGNCPNCGRPLAPGAHFCSGCGYSLPLQTPPQLQTPYPQQAPPYQQQAPPSPQAPPAYAEQPAGAYPPPEYTYPAPAAPYPQGTYPIRPAYAYPMAESYYAAQQVPRKTGHSPLWALVGAGVLSFMVVLGSIAYLAGPARNSPGQCSASTCPRPPRQAPPLGAPHVYISSKYGFQVAYYDHPEFGSALKIAVQDDHQIGWAITSSKSDLVYPITIAGQDAGSNTADSIVDSIQQARYPDAQKAYAIPGVQLGYANGTGSVYDINIKSGSGASVHGRLIIAAAIRNGVAITVVVVGPYRQTTPNDGHPNPADTQLAGVADDLASNITFKGDTPL